MQRLLTFGATRWTQQNYEKPATRFDKARRRGDGPSYRRGRMRTFALYATLSLAIVATLIILSYQRADDSYIPKGRPESKDQQDYEARFRPSASGWGFDYRRDGRNFGLSEEQCSVAFPELYTEIDRAVQHRKDKWGKITLDEVDVEWRADGMVRAMIHDKQLYVIEQLLDGSPHHRPRAIATLSSIQRALTAYTWDLPDIEFSLSVQDFALHDRFGNSTTWAYTRLAHQEKLWLMPDFGLWSWPEVGLRSYGELQAVLDRAEGEFVDKIPKIVWRGSLDVGSKDVRNGLVEHSKGQKWSDVLTLDWSNATNIEERLLTMQDHCSYMFVAQTEGNSYSGRLKYLLNCHSILFSHELEWIELYHHLLKQSGSDQNYVRVKRDYSDLPSKMNKLTRPENILHAKIIADNAKRTFRQRYLTPAAEACYWRAMIHAWGSMMAFEPEFWTEVEEIDKMTQKKKLKIKPRGVPFESYAIMEDVDWEIPAKPRKICIEEE